jgi:RimJ/RimL family protein N-acetyltransferase
LSQSAAIDDLLPSVSLRPVTMEDAACLLEWRNDPTTRAASHNTEQVPLEIHLAWLDRALQNPSRYLYMAEHDGTPVGTVRADLSAAVWEMSWTVAPEYRRRGFGKAMVAAVATRHNPIRAEIKAGNAASIRIATASGMRAVAERDGILHFARP